MIDLASNWFQGFNDVNYELISSNIRGKSFILVNLLLIDPGTSRHNTQLSLRLRLSSKNLMKIIDVEIEKPELQKKQLTNKLVGTQ